MLTGEAIVTRMGADFLLYFSLTTGEKLPAASLVNKLTAIFPSGWEERFICLDHEWLAEHAVVTGAPLLKASVMS